MDNNAHDDDKYEKDGVSHGWKVGLIIDGVVRVKNVVRIILPQHHHPRLNYSKERALEGNLRPRIDLYVDYH